MPLDNVTQAKEAAIKSLQDAGSSAAAAVDDGLQAASQAARSSAAYIKANAERARDEGQTFLDTGRAHAAHTQNLVFDRLKDGVHWVLENQEISATAAAATALVVLPGPRRWLWRRTIGRFRSEEAQYKSAERQYHTLAETLDGQSKEATKLAQRIALAEEQFDQGLRKLTAASKQLASLKRQVHSTERSAQDLIMDLRQLPSKDALALRAEMAAQAAAARMQRQGLERTLYGLAKKGVY